MRSDLRRVCLLAVLALSTASLAEPLVGPSVGNGDGLVAEGQRLYNKKKYAESSRLFLQATRASPTTLPAYLGLARSRLGAKDVAGACVAYRAYLRSAPDIQDRGKAKRELELCERQFKAAYRRKKAPVDLTARHVELKSAFFAALEAGKLVGPGSAGDVLATLVSQGYLGVDLGEMGTRLSAACRAATETLHGNALSGEAVEPERLRESRALFDLARDTGEPAAQAASQLPFLEGQAALRSGDARKAQALFAQAAAAAPARPEYRVWRASALQQAGDLPGALAVMEAELPQDSRTDVLRAATAQSQSPEAGARELERLLFQRYAATSTR
ncbi:hypothetical protein DRW03_24120 [Corallococcus sp. H22C18031201]|nr:hypothetical protein DRW03_24120 [Corallococcus sp. H22C18031201]